MLLRLQRVKVVCELQPIMGIKIFRGTPKCKIWIQIFSHFAPKLGQGVKISGRSQLEKDAPWSFTYDTLTFGILFLTLKAAVMGNVFCMESEK